MRAIIHIDMDAYYASVEEKDHPEFKGQPVIVGGSPQSRGVVASASYEARTFGIRSAMASSQAYRLCPQAIFVQPRFERYEEISKTIMGIFRTYTDLVEPLSLDEAYLDVTHSPYRVTTVTDLARQIKLAIFQKTGLTASAGVGPNKFVAKIASDYQKPDGLTVVKPKEVQDFLAPLPIGKMWGVGIVTEKEFKTMGIKTIGELRATPLSKLLPTFGKFGYLYQKLSRGEDDRPVETSSEYKSVGQETTFEKDTLDLVFMKDVLYELCQKVSERLISDDMRAHTVTLKVKYHDFKSITRSLTSSYAIQKAQDLMNRIQTLLARTEAGKKEIRLLGVSTSNFDPKDALQLVLFKDLL